MNEIEQASSTQISRRALLRNTGAIGAGVILTTALRSPGPAGADKCGDTQTERVQDVLDILATNEAFGVTLVGTILDSARRGAYSPALPDKVLKNLRAVRAQEQFHLDALKRAGARLRTRTFYLSDPNILTDHNTLFTDLVELEDAAIAAVMASFQTFTREKRFDLVKMNFQFAAEESEHRLLANRALGTRPANDQAFAPKLYTTVAEFYATLKEKGIIGGAGKQINGSGQKITYPGPGAIDASNVIYTTPGGPAVACAPPNGSGPVIAPEGDLR